MRMQEVTKVGGHAVIAPCLRCGTRINGNQEKVFADFDGAPWCAYYHEDCADEVAQEAIAKKLEEENERKINQ
jgi:proline racemase